MKSLACLALCLTAAACNTTGGTRWVDYGLNPMENPQYMTDMMAAGAVGPQHEDLSAQAGTWTVEGHMWEQPGAEGMPMNATAKIESLLGGRYIMEEFKSEFMGVPFEGRLIQGYDNVTERYWSLWMDSMSTGSWMSYGTETSPGVFEFAGTARDILTPDGRPTRMKVMSHDDDTYSMQMFDKRPGTEEFMTMELRYKRN